MSDSAPPRACLADFDFITAVVDPGQKLSCSAQLEGGTVQFMAPELLVPEMYGKTGAKSTRQADIYAFGLLIFQVRGQDYGYRPFSHTLSPGSYGQYPVPWYSGLGDRVPCA